MAEDGPASFGFSASGLYRTALAGFAIPIIITENLIIFLPGVGVIDKAVGSTTELQSF